MKIHQRRLPRFCRVVEETKPMRLTDRDHEILRRVACHRFLRSSHITQLVAGSRQQILRRLQSLYHHGYLERPLAQLDALRYQAGSKPLVYGLGSRGAALLRREYDVPFSRLDWSSKNRGVRRLFLEHALMISDFMVSMELACRERDDILFVDSAGTPLDGDSLPGEPLAWRVKLDRDREVGVVPDAVFGLAISGDDPAFYLLEADRGTMPVVRRSTEQTSISRKLLAYSATWQTDIHRDLGMNRFRVLTVTTSEKRLQTMMEAVDSLRKGKGLFLFGATDGDGLKPDPLSFGWQSATDAGIETLLAA